MLAVDRLYVYLHFYLQLFWLGNFRLEIGIQQWENLRAISKSTVFVYA